MNAGERAQTQMEGDHELFQHERATVQKMLLDRDFGMGAWRRD